MDTHALEGGFTQPDVQAAHAFRGIMAALARPGTVHRLSGAAPPTPLSAAAAACLLTLCDTDTPVHLAGDIDTPAVHDWMAFHTGAPRVDRSDCAFAVGRWEQLLPLADYPVGTPAYPDRSATLIVELDALTQSGATLRGPGIRDTAHVSLPDISAFQRNHRQYPLGLDFVFACGDQVAALPRSTEVN
ncbi:MAG: phosphonate C-P lyase system protein PhnH [Pseudomonadota bacterium]